MTATVTVYSKADCHLCADAMTALRALQPELGFALCERDITDDDALHRAYLERIPVIALDGEELFRLLRRRGGPARASRVRAVNYLSRHGR